MPRRWRWKAVRAVQNLADNATRQLWAEGLVSRSDFSNGLVASLRLGVEIGHSPELKPLASSLARHRPARYFAAVSTRELIEKEVAAMPEQLRREVYDFARFLRLKNEDESFNGLLLSESALTKDWNTPEEDAAWASL